MIRPLFNFHGGVHPEPHKHESAEQPIRPVPMPSTIVVPLRHSSRAVARCIVTVGQQVRKGERIGEAEGTLGTAVHAPTSGKVLAIGDHPLPHPSGFAALAVTLQPDGLDEWVALSAFDHRAHDRISALAYLRDAGIVGMGGAAFPSHIKLGNGIGIDTLVINGAECEPWITCDDRLMRERGEAVVDGALILAELIGARRILIGIEDNKPHAIAAMRAALEQARPSLATEVVPVPSRYPAGGEKQLIRVLTGIEIPHGKLGGEFGVQCFNTGTAHAVHRAIRHGEPVISRIVTLTGNARHPGNYEVLIGTPVSHLLAVMAPQPDTERYIHGGPMMGFALPDLSVPIAKGSNCIIAASARLFPAPPPPQPCIRCGECARACPAELQPFELYWFARARNFGKAQEYHLFDCIECGCCNYVCPSHIPLVDYYRFAKSEIWARERDSEAANQARQRFEFRNFRQEREKSEKAARLAAKAAETKARLATEVGDQASAPPTTEDPKKALIAAALARARAQKAAIQPANVDHLPAETEAEIARIEARRQQTRQRADTGPGNAGDSTPASGEGVSS